MAVGSVCSGDALDEIDNAAGRLADLIFKQVAGQSVPVVVLEPVSADVERASLLASRLSGALELAILESGLGIRLVSAAKAPPGAPVVAVQVQPFGQRIRFLVRITDNSGAILAVSALDIPVGADLAELIESHQPSLPEEPLLTDDPYEPDDVPGFEVQVPMGLGQTYYRLLTPGDRDRFSFQLIEPTTVSVRATSDIDTQLLLYEEGDTIPLFVNDDAEDNTGSALMVELRAGWYVAEVVGFGGRASGVYEFSVEALASARGLAGDSIASISAGVGQDRALSATGEEWIELIAALPGFYRLRIEGLDSAAAGLGVTLHHAPTSGPLLADVSGDSPQLTLAFFGGVRDIYARVTGAPGAAYNVILSSFEPGRLFADGSLSVITPPGTHVLRIYAAGSFNLFVAAEGPGPQVSLSGLPGMEPLVASATSGRKWTYHLQSGDYLFALGEPLDGPPWPASVCWAATTDSQGCN